MLCCGSGHYASFFPSWMMIKWWCLLSGTKSFFVSMNNNNRNWNILNWNIRGMNSEDKCLALRQKIDESDCNIMCLQETKRETFDTTYLKKFCPSRINNFAFLPSVGASCGLEWLTILWGDHCTKQVLTFHAVHQFAFQSVLDSFKYLWPM